MGYFKSHVEQPNINDESSAKDLSLFLEVLRAQLAPQASTVCEVTVPCSTVLKLIIKLH